MAIETMMDDREIRNHLDFLGSTESDAGPLRSLKPSAGKPIPEFFKEFYDDLFRVTQSAPIIASNGATLDSLGSVQVGYASLHLDRYTGPPVSHRPTPRPDQLHYPTARGLLPYPLRDVLIPLVDTCACQGIRPNAPMPQKGADQIIRLGVFYRPTRNSEFSHSSKYS